MQIWQNGVTIEGVASPVTATAATERAPPITEKGEVGGEQDGAVGDQVAAFGGGDSRASETLACVRVGRREGR